MYIQIVLDMEDLNWEFQSRIQKMVKGKTLSVVHKIHN